MIKVARGTLCGGSSPRLWPLVRAGLPKQFLSLTGNESVFQQAAQRLVTLGADCIQVAKPLIVTGDIDDQVNSHLGDVLTTPSRNTLMRASDRLVSPVGVEDLIVTETPDAVLVADKSRCRYVRHIAPSCGHPTRVTCPAPQDTSSLGVVVRQS